MSDDLKQRLAVLVARIELCDKLTWGEDSAAMKDALARIEELEAELAKATKALERLSTTEVHGDGAAAWMPLSQSVLGREILARMEFARTTLAELEGKP